MDLYVELGENVDAAYCAKLGAEHCPPLDHEDGCVMAIAAAAQDPSEAEAVYVITHDRDFRAASNAFRGVYVRMPLEMARLLAVAILNPPPARARRR